MEKIKYARKCDKCGKVFNEGYCLGDGEEYFCSSECLHSKYTREEWKEIYKNNEGYWTAWGDKDDLRYYEDGTEVEEEMEEEIESKLNKESLKLKYESDGEKFEFKIDGNTNDKSCKNNKAEIINKQIHILYRIIFELVEARMQIIKQKENETKRRNNGT